MSLHISILNLFLPIVLFLYNWRVNRNVVFLCLLLFLIGTSNIRHALVMHAQEPFWLAIVSNNLTPIWTLIGPCLYLYVRGVLSDRFEWRWQDLIHTIPFWITLVGIAPYLLTSFDYKLQVAEGMIRNLQGYRDIRVNWLLPQPVNLSSRPILQLGYSLACMVTLVHFAWRRKHADNLRRREPGFVYAWLWGVTLFVFLIVAYHLLILILYFRYPTMGRQMIDHFHAVYVIGGILAFLPFLILLFPEILYGIPKYRPLQKPSTAGAPSSSPATSGIEPIGSPDTPAETPTTPTPVLAEQDPFKELGERIHALMQEQQPYLREDFSVEDLARMLEVPKHHLHYCLRNILQTRFVPLRTSYRIAHAKMLLKEANLNHTTIENIGQECGFSSRSAFYKVFKAETGHSPGEYFQYEAKQTDGPSPAPGLT